MSSPAQITIFKKVNLPNEPYYITVDKVVERIKTCKSRKTLDLLAIAVDKDERLKIKKELPAICFSGKFSRRADAGLIEHSGLVAIDFDHLGDRLQEFKKKICGDPITHIAFISPSGDGLKVVVKIPPQIETHKGSCKALVLHYSEETLDNFEDVSRVCFESCDPDIYYNPDSDVFIKVLEDQQVIKKLRVDDVVSDYAQILDRLDGWMERNEVLYQDGNKHKFLVKISAACNRFGIPEVTAASMLGYKYMNKASAVSSDDIKKIVSDVYRNYGQLHSTAQFTVKGEPVDTTTRKTIIKELLEFSEPDKDIIYLDSVRKDMIHSFNHGSARGESTHFTSIDHHFRWKKGELTLMHGIMNQGKSTMIMQMCLAKSLHDGYKWAFFSPEQNPPSEFYDDLVHMYIGKNTQPYYNNQMSLKEFENGMNFVKDHFFYIYPENEMPTPEYINMRFQQVVKKHKVDGCVIDPYNQLDNDIRKTGGREDLYLSGFLSKQKRFAQDNDIFMIIIAHPKSGLSKNGRGDYEMPNIFDLSGGAMWGNKCDNVLCTYRPYATSCKTSREVWFISQKIKKQKLNGTPGDVQLEFDVPSMRYLERYENTGAFKNNPIAPFI